MKHQSNNSLSALSFLGYHKLRPFVYPVKKRVKMADNGGTSNAKAKPKSRSSVGIKGKTLHSQSREIVNNVFQHFKTTGGSQTVTKLWKQTEAATGVGYTTVRRIVSEPAATANEPPRQERFSTPGKNRPRQSQVTYVDSFDLGVMKRAIQDCYIKNELPTLHSLHSLFVREIGFSGCKESLRCVLKNQLGLKYKKINKRKVLVERSDITIQRRQYLRMKKNLEPERSVIYLDETWVNENHNVEFCWQNNSDISGPTVPIGKGKRLILCHAGSEEGFVKGGLLLFRSKTNSQDYHDEMNGEVFLNWFTLQLLPNIPNNSVIVMDNASYHSVRSEPMPTTKSKKADMQAWLTDKKIPWGSDMLKAELYEIIKLYKPREVRYIIDDLAKLHGHTVLRLPPYHCDLNPIELIWAQVKNYVARHNSSHKLSDVIEITKKALDLVTAENWKKACEHVKKIDSAYWNNDAMMEVAMEPFVISVSSHTSSSESDSEITLDDSDLGCQPIFYD